MTSNINISPTQQLGQTAAILNNLGAERQQMDQMKLAEMARQKAQFQDLINKSFQSVSDEFKPVYSQMQNDFVNEASQIYKKSGGFLSMEDQMNLTKLQKPLEEYVGYANAFRKEYNDVFTKLAYTEDDKIDKQTTLARLKEGINTAKTPQEKYTFISDPNNYWTQPPEPIEWNKLSYNLGKSSVVYDMQKAPIGTDNEGNPIYQKIGFNADKFLKSAMLDYEQNKGKYAKSGVKNFEEFYSNLKEVSPDYSQFVKDKSSDSTDPKKKKIPLTLVGDIYQVPVDRQKEHTFASDVNAVDGSGKSVKTNGLTGTIVAVKGDKNNRYFGLAVATKPGKFDFNFGGGVKNNNTVIWIKESELPDAMTEGNYYIEEKSAKKSEVSVDDEWSVYKRKQSK